MKLKLLLKGIRILLLSSIASVTLMPNANAIGYHAHVKTISNTIYVNEDIYIPEDDSLVIEPGTTVMFLGHYSIHVQGKLIALGTQIDSIFFKVADTTGFSNIHSSAGGWNGIRFEDTPAESDSSLFAYCRFEFGKAVGDSANRYGGAIRLINFNKVRVSNSVFSNNYSFFWGGAIFAQKANISLEYCLFEHNYSGNDSLVFGYGGAVCFVSSDPDISFSTFYANASTGIGGGISFEYSNPSMINCIFTENHSGLGGGIGFLRCSPDRSIANILISNNYAQFFGGGIAMVTGSPRMSNLTIVNNYAAMGGGYYCNEYSDPKLFNSILWGNTSAGGSMHGSQVWIWDVYSEPGFYHCNIQYGPDEFGGSMFIGQYENNIDSDPLFTDPENSDFSLQQYSPCINTGTPDTSGLLLPVFDLAMNSRIIHNIIDMGSYEYDGPLGLGNFTMSKYRLQVHPNPVTAGSVVSFQMQSPGNVEFSLLDARGTILGLSNFLAKTTGSHTVQLSKIKDHSQLPSGVYILEMKVAGETTTIKILLP
jgi:predicted outer membrane repeat protein